MSKTSKIIYALLFVVLLLQPHLWEHVIVSFRPYVESAVTILTFGIAYLTYRLQEIEQGKKEKALKISGEKLLDSFQYIGAINRRLPLLQQLSSGLMANNALTDNEKKRIFESLLVTAVVSIAKANYGLLRFVQSEEQRTVKEFFYASKDGATPPRNIGNKELLKKIETKVGYKIIDGYCVICTSDPHAPIRVFLVIPKKDLDIINDYSILQAVADQAQLFYRYLYS